MEQLKKFYASLSPNQRLAIVSAAIASLAGLGLLRWWTAADFRPLYTSLSPEDAGAVTQKLRETGVEYQLAENGTSILVPVDQIAESRLDMAMAGLPKTGRLGFELFDRTNLGVTEFAEQINYQRAIEGELERSIMSLTEVEQSRVHVTFAKESVFTQSREPAKASVLLKLRPGVDLNPRSVVAITHLVAAAVEGLLPQSVSVLDMNGNLLSRPRSNSGQDAMSSSDVFVDYRKALEQSFVDKINATLEPLIGPGRFRAGVSVDCDFTTSEQSEETFNPEQSVILSSQVTEESTGGPGAGGSAGIPGTASALPRPRPETGSGGSGLLRRSENTSYQSSRTVRKVTTPQGTVKRISAAVLVDYALELQGEGDDRKRVVQPREPDKIEAIRELVAAAIGLDTSRGDQLIVQSLPFEETLQLQNQDFDLSQPMPTGGALTIDQFLQDPKLLTIAGGAVLLLVVMVFLLARRSRKAVAGPQATKAPAALPGGTQPADAHGAVAPGSAAGGVGDAQYAGGLAAATPTAAPRLLSAKHEAMVREAKEIVTKDADYSASIVHGWLAEESAQ